MPPKGKNPGNSSSGRGKGRKAPPPIAMSRPKPWGLIAATLVVVLFAGGVLGYAIYRVNQSSKNTPEAKAEAAKSIQGVEVVTYQGSVHQKGAISYDKSPPFGGPHNATWADCTGTVYPKQIASENAVHSLEHGAVWITYQPDLPADQVDVLKKKVDGVEYMLMSPFAGLKTKVSIQSWGHQLFVDSATDPRIDKFIGDLRLNTVTIPEPGASCTNDQFKASPSVLGTPDAAGPTDPGQTQAPTTPAGTGPTTPVATPTQG
jgi:Protein of unknown function (DUF3105)